MLKINGMGPSHDVLYICYTIPNRKGYLAYQIFYWLKQITTSVSPRPFFIYLSNNRRRDKIRVGAPAIHHLCVGFSAKLPKKTPSFTV